MASTSVDIIEIHRRPEEVITHFLAMALVVLALIGVVLVLQQGGRAKSALVLVLVSLLGVTPMFVDLIPEYAVANEARVVREKADADDPVWHASPVIDDDDLAPTRAELVCACIEAGELLLAYSGIDFAARQRRELRDYFANRVPDLLELRARYDGQWVWHPGDREQGVLALTVQDGRSKPICLFVGQIRDCYLERLGYPWDEESSASISCGLCYTILHEVFHLPSDCGGFCTTPADGDEPESETSRNYRPTPEHLGLHAFVSRVAEAAILDRFAKLNGAGIDRIKNEEQDHHSLRLAAACATIRQINGLLRDPMDPPHRYTQVFNELTPVELDHTGPPDWLVSFPAQLLEPCN